jgi:F-type H+-transporting ATPase subunit alpha
LLERAARLATKYVVVPKDFKGDLATEKDSVDKKVYGGPLAKHDAEHAAKDGKAVKLAGSGGSLTALPIIETLLGDVSAYVPTNVISITDGQIYLEANLFYAGIRPAINAGLSVSRVGGDAQTKAMKQVAGGLRLDMASFRDLAAFAQFGSSLDKATQAQLNRGQRLQEILKQPQYKPVSLEHEVVAIFAGTSGLADKIEIERMTEWEAALLRYMDSSHADLLKEIRTKKALSDDLKAKLRKAIEDFNSTWS